MGLCISVVTPEGIVVAGESRQTQIIAGVNRIASDSAIKVFELTNNVLAATAGWACPRVPARNVVEPNSLRPRIPVVAGGTSPTCAQKFQACQRAADEDYQNCVLGAQDGEKGCEHGCLFTCLPALFEGKAAYAACVGGCELGCKGLYTFLDAACDSVHAARLLVCAIKYSPPLCKDVP